MYVSESNIKVRYVETDKMGVVHHSNYLIYFEVARTEFVTASSMSYKGLEDLGIMLPLAESNCKYIQGAKYGDELIIKIWINQLTPVKIEFNYSVIRKIDEKEIAKGSTLHAFVDNNFKIINMKKRYPELLEKLQSLV